MLLLLLWFLLVTESFYFIFFFVFVLSEAKQTNSPVNKQKRAVNTAANRNIPSHFTIQHCRFNFWPADSIRSTSWLRSNPIDWMNGSNQIKTSSWRLFGGAATRFPRRVGRCSCLYLGFFSWAVSVGFYQISRPRFRWVFGLATVSGHCVNCCYLLTIICLAEPMERAGLGGGGGRGK